MDEEPAELDKGSEGGSHASSRRSRGSKAASARKADKDDDKDVGSLISFSSLETTLRGILTRVAKVEERCTMLSDRITEVDAKFALFATKDELAQAVQAQTARSDAIEQFAQKVEQAAQDLAGGIEGTKAGCVRTEEMVAKMIKDKDSVGALVRRVEARLEDACRIGDLQKVEARFESYLPKHDHEQLMHALDRFATVSQVEQLDARVQALLPRFERLVPKPMLHEHIDKLRAELEKDTSMYALEEHVATRFKSVATELKDQQTEQGKQQASQEEKQRLVMERLSSFYVELNEDLQLCSKKKDVEDLKQAVKVFALKKDQEAFQEACLPKLKFCVDAIQSFHERLCQQDVVLTRVDEQMIDKASKYDTVLTNSRLETCMNKDRAMKEFQRVFERMDWITKRIEHVVSAENEKGGKGGDKFDAGQMDMKADKSELNELFLVKENLHDAVIYHREQKLLKRQLRYASRLLAELSDGRAQQRLSDALQAWLDGAPAPQDAAPAPPEDPPDPQLLRRQAALEKRLAAYSAAVQFDA